MRVGNIFSKGKILSNSTDNIIEFDINKCDFGKIIPRGICLNACKYYHS